ncbi:MAG: Asd/ArgC dimerization domain-containing protein [Terriglobales bacterium]
MAISSRGGGRALRVGIAGGSGLQARELAALLPDSALAGQGGPVLRFFAPWAGTGRGAAPGAPPATETERHLGDVGGEAVVLEPLTAENLEGLDAVFFAGTAAETRAVAPLARAAGILAVDLTSALAGDGPGRIRVPHPAAQALAAVLPVLAELGVARTAATVFEPASERGMAGIEELRDQSLRLLAARSLPTQVFGGQIAYNLRVELGEQARPALAEVAAAVAEDLRALAAAAGFALPALHLLQAPVFHAHLVSLQAEWERPPAPDVLLAALRAAPVAFCEPGEPQPEATGTAGENGVRLGAPQADLLRSGVFWLPLSADNLRLRAAAAAHLAARALGRV